MTQEKSYLKSSTKNGSGKVDVLEANLPESGVGKVNSLHIAVPKTALEHTDPTKISKAQVNLDKMPSIEVSLAEVGFSVNSAFDRSISQSPKTPSSEIFFSSSVQTEQFFSIHNITPEIIHVLNNSATNIWSDLLQTETQIDINFQITDLPQGQLAEATIAGFDSAGKPNSGTILIDHDANGLSSNGDVGWFIDETPLDN